MSVCRVFLGCLLMLGFAVAQVQADVITPQSAAATSEFGFNPPSLLIDGSGLDGVGPVESQLHDNVEANNWLVDVFAVPPTSDVDLEFTLDGRYDLSAAYVWNFNNIAGNPPDTNVNFRGVKEFDLLVSPNLVDPFVFVSNYTLNQANVTGPMTSDPEPAQTMAIPDNIATSDVRRIKFEIISNFTGDAVPPIVDPVVGLSEVRFEGVRIPEPATMALAVGALSISLGLMRRRRKRT